MFLHEKDAHLAVLGPDGVGKTSIAKLILHDQRIEENFGDH